MKINLKMLKFTFIILIIVSFIFLIYFISLKFKSLSKIKYCAFFNYNKTHPY